MITIDWFLRIGIQDKDFIINVDWNEGVLKGFISSEIPSNKKEVIEILEKTIQFMKGEEKEDVTKEV